MTPEQFVEAIKAAQTYDEAHAIALQFQPVFAKLSNPDKVKWRNAWKARKAVLQAQ